MDPRGTGRRTRQAAYGVLLLAVVALSLGVALGQLDRDASVAGSPRTRSAAGAPPPQRTLPGHELRPSFCHRPAPGPFTPTSITMPGITRRAPVLPVPRNAAGVPSTAPLTEEGKHEFAWSMPPDLKPGSAHGNALFNAHTWPWSSAEPALGNLMLRGLHVGDRIVVRGTVAGHRTHLCYLVSKRVEFPVTVDYRPYYDRTGPPQIAFVVCSGERLGPENWNKRTVWFASPVAG